MCVASCVCVADARACVFNVFVSSAKVFISSSNAFVSSAKSVSSPVQNEFVTSDKNVCLQFSYFEVSSKDASDKRVDR